MAVAVAVHTGQRPAAHRVQRWQRIEGGGGGRVACNGAVACDGVGDKQPPMGWHTRMQVVRVVVVGLVTCRRGLGHVGQGRMGQGEGAGQAWVVGGSLWRLAMDHITCDAW